MAKKAVQLAAEMFTRGYADKAWFDKFSAAVEKEHMASKKAKSTETEVKVVNKKAKKPKKVKREALYEWSDIEEFIQKKYGRDLRDWAGKYTKKRKKGEPEPEYLDFWHQVCDGTSNGGTLWLCPGEALADPDLPEWEREIYTILMKEFGGGDLKILTVW